MTTRKKWRLQLVPSLTYVHYPSQRQTYARAIELREAYERLASHTHEVRIEVDEGYGWRTFEVVTFPEREATP